MFPELLGRTTGSAISGFEAAAPALVFLYLVRGFARRVASRLARAFVPLLPLIFIIASVLFIYLYHRQLEQSITLLQASGANSVENVAQLTPTSLILKETSINVIPDGNILGLYYIGIFACAESAFIVMALKEYLQDLVGLSDTAILTGQGLPPGLRRTETGQAD